MSTYRITLLSRASTFPRIEDSERLLRSLGAENRPSREVEALGQLQLDVILKYALSDITDEVVPGKLLANEEKVEASGTFKSVEKKRSSGTLSQIQFLVQQSLTTICRKA